MAGKRMTAEKVTFFEIRNRIMGWTGISLPTKVLWEHLCQMAWADGSCYPSTQTLALKLGLHIRAIKRSKAELVTKKLINVFHRPNSQTDVIFPFSQFRNIEQRDKNINILSSDILSLPGPNKNNDLPGTSDKSASNQCHIVTPSSDILSPIKENIKRKDKKVHTTYVCDERSSEHEHIIADEPPQNKSKSQIRREKAQAKQQHRESQLADIKSNLAQYADKYPDVDLEDLFRRMDFWLHDNPTGKLRIDLHRTWNWWLNKEQSNAAMRKKFKTKPKTNRQFNEEDYNRYVAELTKP